MPKEFDNIVNGIKDKLKKENPKMKDDEISKKAYAIATAQWKKSHGGKLPTEKIKDWRVIEFYVPITAYSEDISEGLNEGISPDFVIKGTAINETTTLNNVKYVAEELQKAASTFKNVPILLDHKNEVKNIVGRTTENVNFNPTFRRIDYEAKIMDSTIKEMIKDGRIQNVSIGAKVEDLIAENDGSMKAIGIRGLEISLVAVPGDNQANLAQALQNSFCLKEMAELSGDVSEFANELNVVENNMANEEQVAEKVVEVVAEKTAEAVVEKSPAINVNLDSSQLSEMKAQIAELKEMLIEKKKLQEELASVKEDKTVGVIAEAKTEELNNLNNMIVEKANIGYAMYRDYTKEGSDTRLKRLVR